MVGEVAVKVTNIRRHTLIIRRSLELSGCMEEEANHIKTIYFHILIHCITMFLESEEVGKAGFSGFKLSVKHEQFEVQITDLSNFICWYILVMLSAKPSSDK